MKEQEAKELAKRVRGYITRNNTKVRVCEYQELAPNPGKFEVVIQLHNTDIVRLFRESSGYGAIRAVLNSGGWRTVTTKSRMNEVLDSVGILGGVFQRNWEWFFWDRPADENRTYFDGIVVGA